VPGAELAGVDRVVAEVAVGDVAVLVAEQTPALDRHGVEFDLDLGVLGDRLERARQVLDEDPPRLGERVRIVIAPVALVGEPSMLGCCAMERKARPVAREEAAANPVARILAAQGVVILDGGLATELEARGFDLDDELWSARLLAEDPEAIRRVHFDYLVAGADCLVTASYQATIEGFRRSGRSESQAIDLLLRSVRLAVAARDEFWSDPEHRRGRLRPLVAASVGPYGAARADGSEYTGDYDLDEEGLVDFHRARFVLLAASGADLLACETIPSGAEARALARLLAEHPETWAWLSFSCRDGRSLRDGTDFAALVAELDAFSNLAAIGVNCTSPQHVADLVRRAEGITAKPIVVYPNSGETYDVAGRRWRPPAAPTDFAAAAQTWQALGAKLVGGCCRVGPPEIAAMRRALLGDDASLRRDIDFH
jgi:homocysteine S-methyltransferase